ncbi:MAG: DUF695 domain-containing protein [Candidatus Accumulibacter sp.]|jgi:hypothetical protein|nr:DUF695 domain-containing protein [Accumulibacter sp.]
MIEVEKYLSMAGKFDSHDRFVRSYHKFWVWFLRHEKEFFAVLSQKSNSDEVNEKFFEKMSVKLEEIKGNCYYFLAGMKDEHTAELILSAEGNIKNFVFVEELVAVAPAIEGWKFVALKPALGIEHMSMEQFHIKMNGHVFDKNNQSFYEDNDPEYPDEINIAIVHDDLKKKNTSEIAKGVHIFLDCCLGEFEFATTIDKLRVVGKPKTGETVRPILELGEFLARRKNESSCNGADGAEETIPDEEAQEFSLLEGRLDNGNPVLAAIDTSLLGLKNRALYPWIANLHVQFDAPDNNGMPGKESSDTMSRIEDDLLKIVQNDRSILYIGRETGNGEKQMYFACKDFRKISKACYRIQDEYSDILAIEYDIYKDKYWQSFREFESGLDRPTIPIPS